MELKDLEQAISIKKESTINNLSFERNNSTTLKYKGYIGSIEKNEDGTYWGKVVNKPNESIIYEGNSLEELEKDFHEMIDF